MSKWFCFAPPPFFFGGSFLYLELYVGLKKNLFKGLPSPIKADTSNLHVQFSSVQSLSRVQLFATP